MAEHTTRLCVPSAHQILNLSLRPVRFQNSSPQSECARRIFGLPNIEYSPGIAGVGYSRQSAETGNGLTQEFESLANNIGSLTRQPSYVAARSG